VCAKHSRKVTPTAIRVDHKNAKKYLTLRSVVKTRFIPLGSAYQIINKSASQKIFCVAKIGRNAYLLKMPFWNLSRVSEDGVQFNARPLLGGGSGPVII